MRKKSLAVLLSTAMVPLGKETEIVRKYVYLLNCRVQGKILLTVEIDGLSQVRVPKLILQPIVENAYVHGIKPKNGKGSISISAEQKEEDLEISVMSYEGEKIAVFAGDGAGAVVKNAAGKGCVFSFGFLYGCSYCVKKLPHV